VTDIATMSLEQPADADLGNYHRKGSMLDNHTDPFAEREGKTLLWKDVNMTLVCKTARQTCM
jgi:hypothetical protein